MRNIFIALLCYSRFSRLNCNGCSDFSLCVRHFVKDVAEELFTFTVYKSLEKRFLWKIKKWIENIQKGNVKYFDKSRPKNVFQRQIKKAFLMENLSSLAFPTAFGPKRLRTFQHYNPIFPRPTKQIWTLEMKTRNLQTPHGPISNKTSKALYAPGSLCRDLPSLELPFLNSKAALFERRLTLTQD